VVESAKTKISNFNEKYSKPKNALPGKGRAERVSRALYLAYKAACRVCRQGLFMNSPCL
jgi:hypothetical protein